MAQGEKKLADEMGRYAQVVVDGEQVDDVQWTRARLLCSTERLLIVHGDGKRAIQLETIRDIGSKEDIPEAIAQVSAYLRLETDTGVYLLAPEEKESVEAALFKGLLHTQSVLVKHPAVKGGVVTDAAWTQAKLNVQGEELAFATEKGEFVEVELDDVGDVDTGKTRVKGTPRPVCEASFLLGDTVVETHFAGISQHVSVLASFLERGAKRNEIDFELDEAESDVLMALYSGVDPFKVHEFVGLEPERVDEIYDDLIEEGLLTNVRTRREVTLKPRGRVIAGDAVQEQ